MIIFIYLEWKRPDVRMRKGDGIVRGAKNKKTRAINFLGLGLSDL